VFEYATSENIKIKFISLSILGNFMRGSDEEADVKKKIIDPVILEKKKVSRGS
jgi:hypothetical protein